MTSGALPLPVAPSNILRICSRVSGVTGREWGSGVTDSVFVHHRELLVSPKGQMCLIRGHQPLVFFVGLRNPWLIPSCYVRSRLETQSSVKFLPQ